MCKDRVTEIRGTPSPQFQLGAPRRYLSRRSRYAGRMTSGRGGTYLLTWTTYGSWLRGDERGFVGPVLEHGEYAVHNRIGAPYSSAIPELVSRSRRLMEHGEVVLNDKRASSRRRALKSARRTA